MHKEVEEIKIGSNPLPKYISAGIWALERDKDICLLGRGNNIKTCIDVEEILKRHMEDPEVEVELGSEDYEDRKVSTISITMRGTYIKE